MAGISSLIKRIHPREYLLLGIISRVCKETRKDAAIDAIRTQYDNAMVVRLNEIVVEYHTKHTVHQFTTTVCQNVGRGSFARQFFIEIVEGVW